MKYNLKQATFIIPIRIENTQRLENLKAIIDYLQYHFDTNIFIGEEDSSQKLSSSFFSENIKYFFYSSKESFFYRTKLLNQLIKQSNTPIIINHDCDTIVSINSYLQAYNMLLNNQEDFIWPYDGRFIVIPRNYIQSIKSGQFNFNQTIGRQINHESYGGIIFYNRLKFIEAGMENEKFISWTQDDVERFHRVCKLGYRVKRLDGYLAHIDHPRGINSNQTNPHYKQGSEELNKIYNMNQEQLKEYVKTWVI